jgi:hypothetical protein
MGKVGYGGSVLFVVVAAEVLLVQFSFGSGVGVEDALGEMAPPCC